MMRDKALALLLAQTTQNRGRFLALSVPFAISTSPPLLGPAIPSSFGSLKATDLEGTACEAGAGAGGKLAACGGKAMGGVGTEGGGVGVLNAAESSRFARDRGS
jgi:hypothetical protein